MSSSGPGASDAVAPPGGPRHVAVVVNDLYGYGAQRVAVVLSESLARLGHRVSLVTLEVASRDEWPVADGVERIRLARRGRGPLSFALTALQLRRALHALRPDLVIAHMTFSNLAVLMRSAPRGTPVVVTEHNVLSHNLTIERSPRALALLVHHLYSRATAVVGVSDDVVDDLVTHHRVPASITRRIYNPLSRTGDLSPASPPHPWLVPGSPWTRLLLVGGLRQAKGHEVVLKALRSLGPRRSGFRLVCVGDGPLRDQLHALVQRWGLKDCVAFVGHQPDPRLWMAHADVVLVPSLWEGFGLVAVEAAVVGVPVLASNALGLRELVPTYVRGKQVPRGSADALAAALLRLGEPDFCAEPSRPLSDFDPDGVASSYLAAATSPR